MTKPNELGSTLLAVKDRPASRAGAALLTRALALGIHPTAAAQWIQRNPLASPELRELTADTRRWLSLTAAMRRHRRESHDPRRTAEKAVAWLLASAGSELTGEQHRLALTVVAAVALRTTGPDAEAQGDATFAGGPDLALDLGLTPVGARARLAHAVTLGALDRRMAAPSGVTSKLRIVRAPFAAWELTQEPGPAALVEALTAGERTVLDAIVHPAISFGGDLDASDALLVMLQDADLDPRSRGFSASAVTRSRRRLKRAGVTDAATLLEALDLLAETTTRADGLTPKEAKARAVTARVAAADARTAQIADLRAGGKAAAQVLREGAREVSGRVVPLVREALTAVGAPGDRSGDDLRTWVAEMNAALAPHFSSDAERMAAAAVLAAHVEGNGRSAEQNQRLATLAMTTPERTAA